VSDFDSADLPKLSASNFSVTPEDVSIFDVASHFQITSSSPQTTEEMDAETSMLTDGMAPFDVLASVFGSTLAPSELEEALATNGYDFERAMAWLVDRQSPQLAPQPHLRPMQQSMANRLTLVSRGGKGYPVSDGASGRGSQMSRYTNGRSVPGGNRVCRYFVAGECLRADCRFRCSIFVCWRLWGAHDHGL
jgi:hypothetical protein